VRITTAARRRHRRRASSRVGAIGHAHLAGPASKVTRGFRGAPSAVVYGGSLTAVQACDHDQEAKDAPASTGFLPISLALALFITGLFALDVFDLGCSAPIVRRSE
jgi:hypothetical protein